MKNGTTNLLYELTARQVYSNRANLPASCHFCGSKQAKRGRWKRDFYLPLTIASPFIDFSRLLQTPPNEELSRRLYNRTG